MIDMDTIETSNLNRQFLFRKHHVGKSKAQVAKEAVLKFCPEANVVAHHGNVKESTFDVDFFRRPGDLGHAVFDKDDRLAVEFVTAAANLRSYNYNIPPQSLFDAKGMAGNIVHAVATTNAIVAGLIAVEGIKILEKQPSKALMTYVLQFPSNVSDYEQHFECELVVCHVDTIDEEEHPDGFILEGKVPEAKAEEADGERKRKAEDEDDDVVVTTGPLDSERTAKKPRLDEGTGADAKERVEIVL
eukprot:jgi/Pico_ML_1/50545/g1734.t1